MGDAVLAADAVEQDLGRVRAEPAGEHLAVVGQHLVWEPVALQGGDKDLADAAGIGPLDQPSHDAEPGMVIDAGQKLELAAIGQPDPAHHIQLPQLHRPVPLPTAVIGLAAPAGDRLDQPLADQGPVDRRPRRQRLQPISAELVAQPPRPPVGMAPAQLTDPHLHRGGDLLGTAARTMGPVGQPLQATGRIPIQPGIHALAGDAPPLGHLGHRPPVTQHFHDGVIALLDHPVLPEHPPHPPRPGRPGRQRPGKAGRSVKDHPKPCQASAEPPSSLNRRHNVKDQPKPHNRHKK
jgi:hypothetical protein